MLSAEGDRDGETRSEMLSRNRIVLAFGRHVLWHERRDLAEGGGEWICERTCERIYERRWLWRNGCWCLRKLLLVLR